MTNVIIHGCNGKMGHTILDLLKDDEEITVVAGVDTFDEGKNSFPVFSDIRQCDVRGDVVIDFSVAPAVDGLLEYCVSDLLRFFGVFHHCYGERTDPGPSAYGQF